MRYTLFGTEHVVSLSAKQEGKEKDEEFLSVFKDFPLCKTTWRKLV